MRLWLKKNNLTQEKCIHCIYIFLVKLSQLKSNLKQWNGKWQAQFLISKVSFPYLMDM